MWTILPWVLHLSLSVKVPAIALLLYRRFPSKTDVNSFFQCTLTFLDHRLLLPGSALLLSTIRTMLKLLCFCVADKLTIVLNPCPGASALQIPLYTKRSAPSQLEALQKGALVLGWAEKGLLRGSPQHGWGLGYRSQCLTSASPAIACGHIASQFSSHHCLCGAFFTKPAVLNATSRAYICPCVIFFFTVFGWKESSNQSSRGMAA